MKITDAFAHARPVGAGLIVFLLTAAATAATITWDAGGGATTFWDAPLNWSDNLVPAAGNDYAVSGAYSPRRPDTSGAVNFGGNSLSLSGGATLNLYRTWSGGGTTFQTTIDNLSLGGATIQANSSTGSLIQQLLSNTTIGLSGANTLSAGGGSYTTQLTLSPGLSGSGTLALVRNDAGTGRNINLNGDNSGYSGDVAVTGRSSARTLSVSITKPGGWGTGNLTLNTWTTLTLNPDGTGVVNATAATATVNANATLTLSASRTLNLGTLAMNGGTVSLGAGAGLSAGTLSGSSGTVIGAAGATIQVQNGTFGGAIVESAASVSLTKSSGGTLTLGGANTYSGATTISGGTLALGSAGALQNSSTIAVAAGATFDVSAVSGGFMLGASQKLNGSGFVTSGSSGIAINGLLSPGVGDIGTLTISAPGTLTLAGTTWLEITNSGSVWLHDQIAKAGTVSYGGTLVVSNISAASLALGDSFTLFAASGFANAFTTLVLPALDFGLAWDTSQLAVNGTVSVVQPNDPPVAVDDSATTAEDALVMIDVLVNDTDPDGDALTIQSVTQGAHGSVAVVGTDVTYLPATNWNGSDSFTYTITDGNGNNDTATVSVTVTAINDAPVFTVNPVSLTPVNPGEAIAGTLATYATDLESDSMTFSKLSGPAWLSVAANGALSGTPAQSDVGNNTFVVQAEDSNNATTTASLQLIVRGTLTSVASGQWDTGTTWSDGLAPSGLGNYVIDGETVNTPNLVADGLHAFPGNRLTISGGRLDLKVEHNATINAANYIITNLTLAGGTLRADASVGTSVLNLQRSVAFAGTNAVECRDGSYTVSLHFSQGISGSGLIDFSTDRSGNAGTGERAHLYVSGVNNGYSGNWTVRCFDTTGEHANLWANAAGALGTGVVSLEQRGRLIANAAGALDSLAGVAMKDAFAQLALTQPWSGTGAFLSAAAGATIELGSGASAVGSLATNGAPVAAGTYDASQLSALGLTATGPGTLTVLGAPWNQPEFTNVTLVFPHASQIPAYSATLVGTATDADAGDALTWSKLSGPTWLTVAADGTLSGTPAVEDGGTNQFVVRVSDTHGLYRTAALQIYVNRAPVTAADVAGVTQGQSTMLPGVKVLANDSDPDGDSLSLVGAVATSGSVSVSAGNIHYTAPVSGTSDTITYTVSDGNGATATGTVNVTLTSANAGSLNIVSGPVLENGEFKVGFAGVPGLTYTVQDAASVAGPWSFLTNLTAGANGQFQLVVTNDPPAAQRYFRTVYP